MKPKETVIKVEGLTKRYGPIEALREVSVTVPGGRVGLLGPNGAGKTTLLKVLLGVLDFNQGELQVLGRSVKKEKHRIRTLVGYMPERDVYLPGMTAVDMATYAGRLSGLPGKEALRRAHEALHFVGLEDKRYALTDGYSTGQKQRAKLACALVHDPELLFLDEPTNGLDPEGREAMLELIASLPERRGLTFILSTHLLRDVESVCDHVVMLDGGQIKRSTSLKKMQEGAEGIWLVRPKNGQEEKLAAALKEAGCDVDLQDRDLLVQLKEGAGTHLVLRTALEAGLQVRHLAPHRRSLQDAFLETLSETLSGEPSNSDEGRAA
jgi:ABC-2 type transport system ATP-binding protein